MPNPISHLSDHGSFVHVDGLRYDVVERDAQFIVVKGADGGQSLLCRNCPSFSSDPQNVKNYYCDKCKRFLNPKFPMGRVSMLNGEIKTVMMEFKGFELRSRICTKPLSYLELDNNGWADAMLLRSAAEKEGLETAAAMCESAVQRYEFGTHKTVAQEQGIERAGGAEVKPAGEILTPELHYPGDMLPLLATLANHFEIDSFPEDAELHWHNLPGGFSGAVVRGAINGRVIIQKRDGSVILDTATWEPGARAWSIPFYVNRALESELLKEALQREEAALPDPERRRPVFVEGVSGPNYFARWFADNADTGAFARSVQTELRGPIRG